MAAENTVTKEAIITEIDKLETSKGTVVWDRLMKVLKMITDYATPAEETNEETNEEINEET